jgi:hypothetical protein
MDKLQAHIVLEILGKPSNYVKDALNSLIIKLGSENGIQIINKNLHEPIPAQDSKDIFTTFAEIELELDSLNNYFGILFAYMPSHIELIHPEKTPLTNFELNEIGNKIVSRLHEYDAITKKALAEREFALQKLKEVAPHLVREENNNSPKNNKSKKKKN